MPKEYDEEGNVVIELNTAGWPVDSAADLAQRRIDVRNAGGAGTRSYTDDAKRGLRNLFPSTNPIASAAMSPEQYQQKLQAEHTAAGWAGGNALDQAANTWNPAMKAMRWTQAAGVPIVSDMAGMAANLGAPVDDLYNRRPMSEESKHAFVESSVPALSMGLPGPPKTTTPRVFNTAGELMGPRGMKGTILASDVPGNPGPLRSAAEGFNLAGILPVGKALEASRLKKQGGVQIVPERTAGASSPWTAPAPAPTKSPGYTGTDFEFNAPNALVGVNPPDALPSPPLRNPEQLMQPPLPDMWRGGTPSQNIVNAAVGNAPRQNAAGPQGQFPANRARTLSRIGDNTEQMFEPPMFQPGDHSPAVTRGMTPPLNSREMQGAQGQLNQMPIDTTGGMMGLEGAPMPSAGFQPTQFDMLMQQLNSMDQIKAAQKEAAGISKRMSMDTMPEGGTPGTLPPITKHQNQRTSQIAKKIAKDKGWNRDNLVGGGNIKSPK